MFGTAPGRNGPDDFDAAAEPLAVEHPHLHVPHRNRPSGDSDESQEQARLDRLEAQRAHLRLPSVESFDEALDDMLALPKPPAAGALAFLDGPLREACDTGGLGWPWIFPEGRRGVGIEWPIGRRTRSIWHDGRIVSMSAYEDPLDEDVLILHADELPITAADILLFFHQHRKVVIRRQSRPDA